ncbi:MAG TPA: SRPBCC domain-containing protein [Acidimicrobiales bacterium]|nr:SRPBCC domain-containing protein [Acidimicrobiales bacterium]
MTEPDTTPRIAITRTFAAPPEAVFAAWTEPGQFARWFGGAATTVEDVAMDVQVGGQWRARMVLGDGSEIGWHGAYREVAPPRRLVFTLADRPGDQFELVTVDLEAVEGGTRMAFTQAGGHMPPEQYGRAEAGWQAFFDDLAAGLVAG